MITDVGDLYDPRRRYYDVEGAQWVLSSEPVAELMSIYDPAPFEVLDVHVKLQLFYHDVRNDEIAAFDNSQSFEFALTPGDHAMVLAYRFQGQGWADGSWQAVLQGAAPGLPDPGTDGHIGVWIGIIDADTGILRAVRITSWPPQFTNAVRDAIHTQLRNGASAEAGVAEVTRWVNAHPSPAALVDAKASIIVRGGHDSAVLRDRSRGHR